MRPVADDDAADRVHGDNRADGEAIARLCRSGAEAAFEIRRGRAIARTGRAELEVACETGRGRVAEIAIGWKAPPVLVAAIEQVEQDRTWHDRHADRPDREAAALLAQPGLRAAGRVEPERRT